MLESTKAELAACQAELAAARSAQPAKAAQSGDGWGDADGWGVPESSEELGQLRARVTELEELLATSKEDAQMLESTKAELAACRRELDTARQSGCAGGADGGSDELTAMRKVVAACQAELEERRSVCESLQRQVAQLEGTQGELESCQAELAESQQNFKACTAELQVSVKLIKNELLICQVCRQPQPRPPKHRVCCRSRKRS